MGEAATATGLPESRQPSHVTAATMNLIGTAIERYAPLARAAFASLYFPTNRSA